MKKIILSFSLIFSFSAYAAYQRFGGFGNGAIRTAPVATSQTTQQTVPESQVSPTGAPISASVVVPTRQVYGKTFGEDDFEEDGGFRGISPHGLICCKMVVWPEEQNMEFANCINSFQPTRRVWNSFSTHFTLASAPVAADTQSG